MKAKISIEIDIPEHDSDLSDLELRELLYDNFISIPRMDHLKTAFDAVAECMPANTIKFYKDWAKATDPFNMNYTIEFNKDTEKDKE